MATDKQLRLTIKILCVVGLLSLLSWTLTTFAWGIGGTTIYILLLYPTLFITTILVFANLTFAYYLTILVALSYSFLLNSEIGNLFVFKSQNNVLYLVLALPYFVMLTLIPTTTLYLARQSNHRKKIALTATIIAFSFPFYAIAERYNMNYPDNIFTEYKILGNGTVEITGKPQPSDTRQFYITSTSQELASVAKQQGTFLIDYYYANTDVKKNFSFRTFRSLTITEINNVKLKQPLTWTADEIKGDISFLSP